MNRRCASSIRNVGVSSSLQQITDEVFVITWLFVSFHRRHKSIVEAITTLIVRCIDVGTGFNQERYYDIARPLNGPMKRGKPVAIRGIQGRHWSSDLSKDIHQNFGQFLVVGGSGVV